MTAILRMLAALGLVFGSWLLWGRARTSGERRRSHVLRLAVRHPWLTAAALAAGGLVVALLLVVSGVMPIRASSGHWAITSAFLDFAKKRSVSTHSLGIRAPALDDEALILKGATHFETACVGCHGGPGRAIAPVVSAMTPPPPDLAPQLARWSPEELFEIVKHGIKFTGMPAWPAEQRDDEVWAMVAFLRRLPTLDAAAYRQLAFGDATLDNRIDNPDAPPSLVRAVCSRCHGVDGTGRGTEAFPSLAGQRAAYMYESLRAFRDRTRFSAVMGEVTARLSDDAMREIAAYYERLPARGPQESGDEAALARGRAIAGTGIPARDIPACIECHGPTESPKKPEYPKLTGQHPSYLRGQLTLLQERRRGGTPNVDLMHAFVDRLQPSEIHDAAAHYAALPSMQESVLSTGR